MQQSPSHPTPKQKETASAIISPQRSGAAAARAQMREDFKNRERKAEGELRFQLYQQAMQLIAGGSSQVEAARTIGIRQATLFRWRQRVALGESLDTRAIVGRPPIGAQFAPLLTTAHRTEIARLIISCGSASRAWQQFATTADCPPALREFLHGRKSVPPSLLALVPVERRRATIVRCGNITSIVEPRNGS